MTFESSTRLGSTRPLQGRWLQKVRALTQAQQILGTGIMLVIYRNHPIMQDFKSFKGYYD